MSKQAYFLRKWNIPKPQATIFIIHGLGEHSGRYQHVGEWFNARGIAVYSGDLPGFGQSPGKRGYVDSFEDFVEMLKTGWSEMVSEHPHVPHILLGHSFGGLIATHILIDHHQWFQMDGAIISSPGYEPAYKIPEWKKKLANLLGAILPKLALPSGLPSELVCRDPEVNRQSDEDPYCHSLVSARLYLEMNRVMEKVFHEASRIPKALPVYWMQAGDDRIVEKERTRQLFAKVPTSPLKRYKEWEGFYHEILNEPEKEEVLMEIERFIKEIVEGRDGAKV